jgi:hypothetical protein
MMYLDSAFEARFAASTATNKPGHCKMWEYTVQQK